MRFKLPFGQNKKTQKQALAAQPQRAVSIFPEDENALAEMLRDQLARHYRRRTSLVFQDNGIAGRAPELYVAPRYVGLGVQLANTRDLDKAMKLTRAVGLAAGIGDGSKDPPVESVLVNNLLVYRFVLPEYQWVRGRKVRLWSDVYLDSPLVRGDMAVGLLPNSYPIYLEFSDVNPNFLVCGVQGSGKTELLKTLVYQAMRYNAADQLQIALCDIKGDFEIFASEEHLIWQPAHTFDQIRAVIQHFQAEQLRRARDKKDDVHLRFPRWVLVIDEADHVQIAQDPENQARLLEIGLRGRSVQMHMVIGTHRPDIDSLGDVGKELTIRFLGQQASAKDSGQVEGGLALHKLSGQGDFYYVRGSDARRFQAARVPDSWWTRLNRRNSVPEPPTALPTNEAVDFPSYDRKAAHRPRIEASPRNVVYYLVHGPDLVTAPEAERVLGLKDTGHKLNQKFARELLELWEQAKNDKSSGGGREVDTILQTVHPQ